jgi:hypothetical protein
MNQIVAALGLMVFSQYAGAINGGAFIGGTNEYLNTVIVSVDKNATCTGTLINENTILTAAHCIVNDGFKMHKKIQVGVDSTSKITVTVANYFVPVQYAKGIEPQSPILSGLSDAEKQGLAKLYQARYDFGLLLIAPSTGLGKKKTLAQQLGLPNGTTFPKLSRVNYSGKIVPIHFAGFGIDEAQGSKEPGDITRRIREINGEAFKRKGKNLLRNDDDEAFVVMGTDKNVFEAEFKKSMEQARVTKENRKLGIREPLDKAIFEAGLEPLWTIAAENAVNVDQQTVNSGDSGGAIFNAKNEIIGIASQGAIMSTSGMKAYNLRKDGRAEPLHSVNFFSSVASEGFLRFAEDVRNCQGNARLIQLKRMVGQSPCVTTSLFN